MRKLIFKLILSLIILFVSGCKQKNAPVPLKFKGYESNPVLTPGEPGSWDELFVSAPQVIYFDNLYYLFYMGCNLQGKMAVGLATSTNGFQFTKFPDNPVLAPDGDGFDAYTAAAGILVQNDSIWVMYYNGNELATYAPGPAIGRATASHPKGPWIKDENPVLHSGSAGEWDAAFVIPSSVVRLEDGSYQMYFSGGTEITKWDGFYTGMATSHDGLRWKKYNDPQTKEHPYAESDPVLMPGKTDDWDHSYVWMANVNRYSDDFRMYYTGVQVTNKMEVMALGFASSTDGIKWEKYPGNPVFTSQMDPVIHQTGIEGSIENPCLLRLDSICYLYYDFTLKQMESHAIGVATAKVKQ